MLKEVKKQETKKKSFPFEITMTLVERYELLCISTYVGLSTHKIGNRKKKRSRLPQDLNLRGDAPKDF